MKQGGTQIKLWSLCLPSSRHSLIKVLHSIALNNVN